MMMKNAVKRDEEYYQKFAINITKTGSPNPQRIIIGKNKEVYFTPDHYENLIEFNEKTFKNQRVIT